jgi:hypothetical protein
VTQTIPASRPPWRVTFGDPAPDTVERLLRALPEWFGIESAIDEYVESARTMPPRTRASS